MRVLQLGPYPPPHGGVQTNLMAIRAALLERSDACAVINLHRHRTGQGEAVHHPAGALETLRLLLKLPHEIVHLHLGGELTPRLLALCLVCTLLPRRKTVLTFHSGGYATSPAGRTAAPNTLRGWIFRRFDRIIAVNGEIRQLFLRFGVAPGRVRLIYPHTLPPPPSSELPEPLRSFYAAHDPVLVTVGLLEPEYDLPLQIEALERVRERHPRAGLALIGSGSLEAELRARIGEHVLLPGDVPHAAALGAIQQAVVFLRTTRYDGDSVAVREALHLGTPVVATDNGMRPEGVRLLQRADLGALCEAVECALAGPRPAPARDAAARNIEAVLDLYGELWLPGPTMAAWTSSSSRYS
jgi:glycosyltransferase involved in cell wall biosynthesis